MCVVALGPFTDNEEEVVSMEVGKEEEVIVEGRDDTKEEKEEDKQEKGVVDGGSKVWEFVAQIVMLCVM